MWNQTFKCCLAFLLIAFFTSDIQSRHIVGGEMTYQFLQYDEDSSHAEFLVIYTIYRDGLSGGGDFDDPLLVGIHSRSSNEDWNFYDQLNSNLMQREFIDTDLVCINEPSTEIQMEKGIYQFTISLPVGNSDYYISYQRCCRAEAVLNIENSEQTGIVFGGIITSEAIEMGNSSPTFNSLPPIFVCIDQELNLDYSTTDIDGDRIEYRLYNPLTGGGDNAISNEDCDFYAPDPRRCGPPFDLVNFNAPFTFENPISSDASITINTQSGLLNGVPNELGKYVIGVSIDEYRDDVLLSSITRDFQFIVTLCEEDLTDTESYFQDLDMDGFGNPTEVEMSCVPINGYVLNDLDCDDSNNLINPEAEEIPNNGIDENCDGEDSFMNGDCMNALKIEAYGTYVFPAPQGQTTNDIQNNSCLGQVVVGNAMWLTFDIDNEGSISFEITPQNDDDFDFVVFRLEDDCNDKVEIRSMFAGVNIGQDSEDCIGPTGLRTGESDVCESAGCENGNNNYLAPLDVTEGERYAVLILNFSATGSDFIFEISGSAGLANTVTSVQETNEPKVSIYPNPINNTLYFNNLSSSKEYVIYTSTGVRVKAGSVQNNSIEVSELNQGLYYIQVLNQTIPFIKI